MIGIDVLKECRSQNKCFLPILSSAYRVVEKSENGEVNIGWNAGIIGENRPFYVECWASEGITMLTIYISTIGIEDYTDEQVNNLIIESGYYKPKGNFHEPSVMKFTDNNNNDFFSVNIAVGDEEETFIDGATIYPFSVLNEYNTIYNKESCESSNGFNSNVRRGPDEFSGNYDYTVAGEEIAGNAQIVVSNRIDSDSLDENILPFEIVFDFCNISIVATVDLTEKSIFGDYWIIGEKFSSEFDAEKLTSYFFTTVYNSFDEDGGIGYPIYCRINDTRVFLKDEFIQKRKDFESTKLVEYYSDEIDVHILAEYKDSILKIDGDELGERLVKYTGKDEYEYYYTFNRESSEKLFNAIGAEPGKEKEALLELFMGKNSISPLVKIIEQYNINPDFYVW